MQTFEQHCADVVHAAAFAVQVVPASEPVPVPASPPPSVKGEQTPLTHGLPGQHSLDAAHIAPAGLQLWPEQRRPPSAPGTQGRPSQHWSLNWHESPAAMQHGAMPV